jgi:hypothetical protein
MLEEPTNIGNGDPPIHAEPFSNPPELTQLVGNVKILEEWYSSTFRRRITEITELLTAQISEEVRVQYEIEGKSLIVPANGPSDETVEALRNEIAQLKRGAAPSVGLEEIDRIEKQIHEIETELEHSFTVDSVPLSRLLQLRTTQTDLKSYLRGLKYFTGKSSSDPNPGEHSHRS